jgi:hypothetical protein
VQVAHLPVNYDATFHLIMQPICNQGCQLHQIMHYSLLTKMKKRC